MKSVMFLVLYIDVVYSICKVQAVVTMVHVGMYVL